MELYFYILAKINELYEYEKKLNKEIAESKREKVYFTYEEAEKYIEDFSKEVYFSERADAEGFKNYLMEKIQYYGSLCIEDVIIILYYFRKYGLLADAALPLELPGIDYVFSKGNQYKFYSMGYTKNDEKIMTIYRTESGVYKIIFEKVKKID